MLRLKHHCFFFKFRNMIAKLLLFNYCHFAANFPTLSVEVICHLHQPGSKLVGAALLWNQNSIKRNMLRNYHIHDFLDNLVTEQYKIKTKSRNTVVSNSLLN